MRIRVSLVEIAGAKRILVRPLVFTDAFRASIKKIRGGRWSPLLDAWHIPYTRQAYRQLRILFGKANISVQESGPGTNSASASDQKSVKHDDEVTRLVEYMMLRRYSHRTIKVYRNYFLQLLAYYPDKHPADLEEAHIKTFLLAKLIQKKWSASTQNQFINAIKFYFEQVLKRDRTFFDFRPKRPRKLPEVFSEQEVVRLFRAVDNPKHRFILMLIYSAGLRLSELINLRAADVNISRRTVFIKGGKGKKTG